MKLLQEASLSTSDRTWNMCRECLHLVYTTDEYCMAGHPNLNQYWRLRRPPNLFLQYLEYKLPSTLFYGNRKSDPWECLEECALTEALVLLVGGGVFAGDDATVVDLLERASKSSKISSPSASDENHDSGYGPLDTCRL
ncbi:hypothetical protein WG66_010344 [Moniliophthora roreri]|nr:hypothetical protein WG66_010344 [Moniliophthora roreri]